MKSTFLILTLIISILAPLKAGAKDAETVKVLNSANDIIKKDTERVYSAEAATLSSSLSSYYAQYPDAFLDAWLDEIANGVKNSSLPFRQDINAKMLKVISEYHTKENELPIEAAKRLAIALEAIVKSTDVFKGSVVIDEFATLRTELEKVEDAFAVSASKRRARALNTLLTNAALQQKLLEHDTTGLRALRDTLTGFLGSATKTVGVHVISATFGELPGGGASDRSCDALPHMIGKCEARANCTLGVSAKAVCGYDPVPLLEDARKALVVEYACLAGDDARWARLQVDRTSGVEEQKLSVYLRSSTDTIMCRKP